MVIVGYTKVVHSCAERKTKLEWKDLRAGKLLNPLQRREQVGTCLVPTSGLVG
jgi:hypothetical protein